MSEKKLKKRKYDSKYKSEWASEFAGVVKGPEEYTAMVILGFACYI